MHKQEAKSFWGQWIFVNLLWQPLFDLSLLKKMRAFRQYNLWKKRGCSHEQAAKFVEKKSCESKLFQIEMFVEKRGCS